MGGVELEKDASGHDMSNQRYYMESRASRLRLAILRFHFNILYFWDLDVMMRLSGEGSRGSRTRAAPLQSSLDYRNAHCLPTLVPNLDATEYFTGYVSMKIGVWSSVFFGIMPRWVAKAPGPQEQKSHRLWAAKADTFQFQFIKSCLRGVKCDVKQTNPPFSSQALFGWNRTPEKCQWSWNAKSRNRKAEPRKQEMIHWPWNVKSTQHTQSWRSLGKLVATYYFATSLFGTDLYLGPF